MCLSIKFRPVGRKARARPAACNAATMQASYPVSWRLTAQREHRYEIAIFGSPENRPNGGSDHDPLETAIDDVSHDSRALR